MIDLDSFFDGDSGMEGVLELSTKISLISIFDLKAGIEMFYDSELMVTAAENVGRGLKNGPV